MSSEPFPVSDSCEDCREHATDLLLDEIRNDSGEWFPLIDHLLSTLNLAGRMTDNAGLALLLNKATEPRRLKHLIDQANVQE